MKPGSRVKSILVAVVAAGLIVSVPEGSLAAKAQFKAGVNPSRLSLSVNSQGGITGTKTVTVDVHRIQVGRSAACNKIQTVEVLRGMDPLPPDAQLTLGRFAGFPDRSGRCYFDINMTVQPFTDDEIRGVCNGVSSGNSGLAFDGLVTAWNKDPSYLDSIRNMRNKGGSGGVGPKNRSQVKFAATVNCGGSGSGRSSPGGFRVPTGTSSAGVGSGRFTPRDPRSGQGVSTGGAAQCNLTGTWDRYDNGTRNTGWKFEEIFKPGSSTTYRATHLTNQRTPTGSEGAIISTSTGNYLFHTLPTKIPGANGSYQASSMKIYDVDASCSKLTERPQVYSTTSVGSRGGNNWLQRVGAPPRPVASPVGRPTGPTNTFRPRRAPTRPGDTYQPGPNTPKPPRQNTPRW